MRGQGGNQPGLQVVVVRVVVLFADEHEGRLVERLQHRLAVDEGILRGAPDAPGQRVVAPDGRNPWRPRLCGDFHGLGHGPASLLGASTEAGRRQDHENGEQA